VIFDRRIEDLTSCWLGDKVSVALDFIKTPFIKRPANIEIYIESLRDKRGIEIGGPTSIFKEKSILPIYPLVGHLDGCNYSNSTIWDGLLKEGWTYNYQKNKNPCYQYICEALDLSSIGQGTYDFVLSSHCIEHIANPLKAISEWKRILKDNGLMLLIIPHKDKTFDHDRPITSLSHLIEDMKNDVQEDDLTHLPEILELHDLKRDPDAGDFTSFKNRSKENYLNRCLHHHVFDTQLVIDMLKYMDLSIITSGFVPPYHIIVLAKYERDLL
jgi:SAM-dependent methyltransferase